MADVFAYLEGFGTGGGSSLYYSVVCSTTEPAKKEGRIWVKSAVPMTQFEVGRPWTTAKVGVVLITGDLGGPNPTSTNKTLDLINTKVAGINNRLKCTPVSCIQAQGSAGNWISVDAYVCHGNTWVQISSAFSSTINITYPAGSTCTCKNGSMTFTAPNTSGTWKCVVPNTDTWTISCTNTFDTISENVSITESGQSKSVTLYYYLFNAGKWRKISSFEASKSRISRSSLDAMLPTVSGTSVITISGPGNDGSAFSNTKIDLTNWKTLKLNLTATAIDNNSDGNTMVVRFGVTSSNADKYTAIAYKNMRHGQAAATISVDVTSIKTSAYLFFSLEGWGASKSISFNRVWLE